MFTREHLTLVVKGIKLFNARYFWECHEELEDVWMDDLGPVRDVYWGIIQIATSLYHYEDGNEVGAFDMLYKAKEKFQRAHKGHVENPLLYRSLSWKYLRNLMVNLNENNQNDVIEKLNVFKFPNPESWEKRGV